MSSEDYCKRLREKEEVFELLINWSVRAWEEGKTKQSIFLEKYIARRGQVKTRHRYISSYLQLGSKVIEVRRKINGE